MNREKVLKVLDELAETSSNFRSYLHISAHEQADTSEFEHVAGDLYDWLVFQLRPALYDAMHNPKDSTELIY